MLKQSISVGIILNQNNQVLISQRQNSQHLTGYWEFPGGKLQPGESFKLALRRELYEEIGIHLHTAEKILHFQHRYSDRQLSFEIFKVSSYAGEIKSKENQVLRWVSMNDLGNMPFPDANRAMIDALRLPSSYMIADEKVFEGNIISVVTRQLQKGVSLIQHRANNSSKADYVKHSHEINALCKQYQAKLIVNCPLEWLDDVSPRYVHLNSLYLNQIYSSNISIDAELFSASCHNEDEVRMANELNLRCQIIGPVNYTQSHKNASTLGWKNFSKLCLLSNMPVFALGGMKLADKKNAIMYGAQGIASIRAFKT